MTIPEKHFKQTKRLLSKIDVSKISTWLLEQGYYPEQYVLPPPFVVNSFALKKDEYFKVRKKGYTPTYSNLERVAYPKSQLTERAFGIMEPKLYHDIVWNLDKQWELIIEHLFNKETKIYSYSFPIPVTKKNEGELGSLRVGRMIYEFIEMAENDLVSEAHKYKYVVKTDIKNFYPSIYTHSIAWALHGKTAARIDKFIYALLGNKLDKLLQSANDGCTNGIPIGSALSDLISEILLSAVDKETSLELKRKRISYLGVRYKDDYRFLCNSRTDAESILKVLQAKLRDFNLALNENKSVVNILPEGLYRSWTIAYHPLKLKYKKKIPYRKFEETLLAVLKIDKENPDTGVIDRFLSDLYKNDCTLKLNINENELLKVYSLLLMLKRRRAKSFPLILAIIEDLLKMFPVSKHRATIYKSLNDMISRYFKNEDDNLYDLIWLTYFVRANNYFSIKWPTALKSNILNSIRYNKLQFFNSDPEIDLFNRILKAYKIPLSRYLSMFFR